MDTFHSPGTSVWKNLVDLLCQRALNQGNQIAYTFLGDNETAEATLTYAQLDSKARALASHFQYLGMSGERALLLYPPGLEYIIAFFGCLYAGIVAVPVYPPQFHKTLSRLQSIVRDARPLLALSTEQVYAQFFRHLASSSELASLRWIATDRITDEPVGGAYQLPEIGIETLAFLQYTSGSTAAPKGVMLTHGNLLSNLAQIYAAFELSPESRGCIWLPPYHDMGLIGGILAPLYGGFPITLLSPLTFLQQPIKWLQAISNSRATVSGGPNFAYDFCVSKITPDQRAQLDLSCWEVAFTGAEPVHHATIERFINAFAPCGFRRSAFYACYGLAESTLLVSGGSKTAPSLIETFDREALEHNQVRIVPPDHLRTQTLVGCGTTFPAQKIVIAQPYTLRQCAPQEVGEIWVASPSVAQGYWEKEEETQATMRASLVETGEGPFLRTGDLGFLNAGELFVTGRLKDLLIIRGRNHYPQDIEQLVATCYPGVRQGGGAAFSVTVEQEEQLVIVQEVERQVRDFNTNEAARVIRQTVTEEHGIPVATIVFIKQSSISKTSSGKIQRQQCRSDFLNGKLVEIGRSMQEEVSKTQDDYHVSFQLSPRLFAALTPDERRGMLEPFLRTIIAQRCKLAPSGLSNEQSLRSLALDSLATLEIKNDIEAHCGVVLPVSLFFEDITLSRLVDEILSHQLSTVEVLSPASGINEPVCFLSPLSNGQKALWFLHQLAPSSAAYTIARTVIIHQKLDLPAFQRTIQQLVDRHPALRTTFPLVNDNPVQQVQQHMVVHCPVEDASAWKSEQIIAYLEEQAQLPFDLQHGPLLRCLLLQMGEQQYALLFALHHIIADFSSISILVGELAQYYLAEQYGTVCSLPALEVHYGNFVSWQSAFLTSPKGIETRQYWEEQLKEPLPVLDLPIDAVRPPIQSYSGSIARYTLDATLTRNLLHLAHEQQATTYTFLLTAFFVTLYRSSGQEDIILGSPVIGRNHPQWKYLVGYLVNTLALRARMSGEMSFLALLEQVKQTVINALDNQDYPFPLLVEQRKEKRDASRSPLFQVMFGLEQIAEMEHTNLAAVALGMPGASMQVGGLSLEALPLDIHTAQFDLTIMLAQTCDTLIASLEYNTDLFHAASIQRFWDHFQQVLRGIVENPTHTLAELPFLTAEEFTQVVTSWNQTETTFPQMDQRVYELFEQQVELFPEAVAISWGEQTLTYRELNRQANEVAHLLSTYGIGLEARVGLYMDRSPELIVGLLGILKVGSAFVPFDPTYSSARLTYMLEDAQLSALLTQEHLRTELPAKTEITQLFCLNVADERFKHLSAENRFRHVQPENLAYIIYTSGSTGVPKGVLVTHQGLSNLILSQIQAFGVQRQDRILQFASPGFDAAVSEIFMALVSGACLVLAPRDVLLPGETLLDVLNQQAISVVTVPPSILAIAPPERLSGLQVVISAGEALNADLVARWLPGRRLYNAYGPTEATVCASLVRCSEEDGIVCRPSIGHPLPNTHMYLLDAYGNPVPVGTPGEIYLGGIGLARGYLNHPEWTAERFVPHPFGQYAGARLYRTGDLARYRSNGTIEYLGRVDHQVKMRGFRIEPGEIEAVLGGSPDVQECVVVPDTDRAGNRHLVAYLTLSAYASAQQKEANTRVELQIQLRHYLRERLPEFMVPGFFLVLETFPRTTSGKIDRWALPPLAEYHPEMEGTYQEPRTAVERVLIEIWKSVLGQERIGVHDNFFVLGGHSLIATQITSRIRDLLALDVPLHSLFTASTVAELAQVILSDPEMCPRIEQTAQILLEIDQLSEETVHELMAQKTSAHSHGETIQN